MEELLNAAGRIWFKEQYPEELKGLSPAELGWLDNDEGIPVDDRFVLTEKLGIGTGVLAQP